MLVDEHLLHALGHAADDADDESALALVAQGVQLVESRENLLLGIVAHRARVDKYRIGLVDVLARLVARHLHHRGDNLAVSHIHLASVGLQQQPLGRVTLTVIYQFHCHVSEYFCAKLQKNTDIHNMTLNSNSEIKKKRT